MKIDIHLNGYKVLWYLLIACILAFSNAPWQAIFAIIFIVESRINKVHWFFWLGNKIFGDKPKSPGSNKN